MGKKLPDNHKLVLVTSINPTPAGEGKSTVLVGLGDALTKLNHKTIIAMREPSMGSNGDEGWSNWRWLQPGCPNGRHQFTLYW